MKLRVLASFTMLSLVLLSGCSYISKPSYLQHRDTDYLTAKTEKPLLIPTGLSSNAIHSEYPVSEHAYEGQSKTVSLLPPGIKS